MQSNVITRGTGWKKEYKWTLFYDRQPVPEATGIKYQDARDKEAELIRTGKYNRLKFAVLPYKRAKV